VRPQVSEEGKCLELTDYRFGGIHSGSKFLKSWMEFLEENADLRYPDLDDVLRDE
jgi:hypothetical protein